MKRWRSPTRAGGVLLLAWLVLLVAAGDATAAACWRGGGVSVASGAVAARTDGESRTLAVSWDPTPGTREYRVTIDDGPEFRTPILSRAVPGARLDIALADGALAPGVRCRVRIEPGPRDAELRVRPDPWCGPVPGPDYLLEGWRRAGRPWVERYSGVRWDEGGRRWALDPAWPNLDTAGLEAYNIEYAMRPAVHLALVTGDRRLLEELAGFYLVYAARFVTLAELRARQARVGPPGELSRRGADSARTLPWLENVPAGKRWRECDLCNAQFFHPASRLLRVISTLDPAERSDTMKGFVRLYAPLIVRDQLLRLAYEVEWSVSERQLVAMWRAIAAAGSRPGPRARRPMADRDLWLIAAAAEILGAEANDPALVTLTDGERSRLQELVRAGVELFQAKRTVYQGVRALDGRTVSSASYFNGDYDGHPEMAWAGYGGEAFPGEGDRRNAESTSWDISHFYRVPVFLRALYDNRKATGPRFPEPADIDLVVNQYAYRVFHGDFERPLFRNFFDGRDGWYRVGYHGAEFGYPPSRLCEMRRGSRPCLTVAGVYGWGLLAFLHPDLLRIERSLVELAVRQEAETVEFRERYYRYNAESLAFRGPDGSTIYPFLLWTLLASLAEWTT